MATPPAEPPPIVAPAPGPAAAIARPWSRAAWLAEHDGFVARAQQGGIAILFLGDSITARFPQYGAAVWERSILPLGPVANFGIGGDRTQFVLWRAQHGELTGSQARVVVLMVGTNNLATASPEGVAQGIAAIVAAIRTTLPDAVVVLNAILPRGKPGDPLREKLAAVNARIAKLADANHVRWLDTGAAFLAADGSIPAALMPDGLHPSNAGYEIWATALRPLLLDVLSK